VLLIVPYNVNNSGVPHHKEGVTEGAGLGVLSGALGALRLLDVQLQEHVVGVQANGNNLIRYKVQYSGREERLSFKIETLKCSIFK